VPDLLAYAGSESSAKPLNPKRIEEVDDRQVKWILSAGLGPLLYRAAIDGVDHKATTRSKALWSADLTAQIRHGNLVDTAKEVIDTCHSVGVMPTLLKGISISDQHYPVAHLRPMGDIDILVPWRAREVVESAILKLGYSRMRDFQLDRDSVHGVPLFHSGRSVWVEVHTTLFPRRDRLSQNYVFSPACLDAHSINSTFHGRPIYRLTDELQLIYTASFWIRDLSRFGFHASYLPPLFDVIYLLKNSGQTLNWDRLLCSLDNEMAKASFYVMLTLLSGWEFLSVPSSVPTHLASSQKIVGAIELRLINLMLEAHLIRGQPFTRLFQSWHVWDSLLAPGSHATKLLLLPWNIVFPEQFQKRYSPSYQLERIGKLLRRLW
jgi:hypothetical protein